MSQTMPDADDLAEALADAVNVGVDSEELTDTLAKEHPHLQNQIFMEVVKPIIIDFAQREHYDDRNAQAIRECREIVEKMDWYVDDDLPDK